MIKVIQPNVVLLSVVVPTNFTSNFLSDCIAIVFVCVIGVVNDAAGSCDNQLNYI